MLDRTVAPVGSKLKENFEIQTAQSIRFPNGVFFHTLYSGTQETLRLEFIFEGGNWNQSQAGASYFTTKLLSAGTAQHSNKDIEQKFAFEGAFLELESNNERNTITIYLLSKHLEQLLSLIYELLTEPSFPIDEIQNLKNITEQNLSVNMGKTSFLASNKFKEVLFGAEHPYGRMMSEEVIQAINKAAIHDFFDNTFTSANCNIILSGNAGNINAEQLIRSYFGNAAWGKTYSKRNTEYKTKYIPQEVFVEKNSALQSSIRLGLPLFNITHPDYLDFAILVEILGGYFGSRLMKNIREEKGYTYGISASLVSLQHAGYLVIGTDVDYRYTDNTIEEIKFEIKRLKEEEVGAEELKLVQNYLIGAFLNSINTPFALADRFKSIYFNGLESNFYSRYLRVINEITPEKLQYLANKYFIEENLTKVVAGSKQNM